MKKSELLLNPYKEHLKKPYLHGAGTLEINGVQYSADEYITMLEEANKKLKSDLDRIKKRVKEHTTYTVKAEFIEKFGDIYVYDAKQVRDIC